MRLSLALLVCLLLTGCWSDHWGDMPWTSDGGAKAAAEYQRTNTALPSPIRKSSINEGNDILIGMYNGSQVYSNDVSHQIWYQSLPHAQPYALFFFVKPTELQGYVATKLNLRVEYKTNLSKPSLITNMTDGALVLSMKDFPNFYLMNYKWEIKQ